MTVEAQRGLAEIAAEAVTQLDADLEPDSLPEDDPDWNAAYIGAIRSYKEQFRGSKDLRNLLRIAGELLYGKDIHWAMELVQNAEDAGARRLVFVFEPERVAVWNDGVPFAAKDVWAICSAGHSAKKNKIGFFGIGFKSVYKISATPEIYSGPYALRIEDKLYPSALDIRRQGRAGAWFVLPLTPEHRGRIHRVVGSLVSHDFAQVLLTLTSLTEIRVIDRTGAGLSGRFWRQPLRGGVESGWDECEIGGSWGWAAPRVWRRFFHQTTPVPEGIQREGRSVEAGDRSLVVLSRPVDDAAVDLRLHCFLPTAVPSQLRWLVQADFEPSASREQLRQSAWNEWLMGQVGEALAAAVRVSARSLGVAPWELTPLDLEVRDQLQRIAYDAAIRVLQQAAFISTRRGWRRASESTWGLYPGVGEVVREGDLAVATGRDVSYVREDILGPISDTSSRAEQVLGELGAKAVHCDEVVALFGADEAAFGRVRRDASWWIAALGFMARHATPEQKGALAATPCLPVRGGGRVRPSPKVDADGYLVAFSRSDLSEDLREYLGESQVLLVEPFLLPQADGGRRARRRSGSDDALSAVIEMLEVEPFGVAPEAGPYHVVANLVLPRLAALQRGESLGDDDIQRARRLVEYVRQKWPTYTSEYRRRRNERASDALIGAELGQRLLVVARVGTGRRQLVQLRPPAEAYLSAEYLGWEAMEAVMADDPDVAVIDPVHKEPLRVVIKRRGGRARSAAPEPLDFLRLLGAAIGPRVVQHPLTQVSPRDISWVDWQGLPSGARRRVGLSGDWDSPDVARLVTRWPGLSARSRARRAGALLRAIEADWPRLKATSTAVAQYFYGSWTTHGVAASTWVGRLRQMEWMPSLAGTLEQPELLSVDTPANRQVLGDATDRVLRWKVVEGDAIAGLGVRARPGIEEVVDRLGVLRASDALLREQELVVAARACYQTLADHLRDGAADPEVRRLVATRMRGGGGRGLIYAPPPEGVAGERWWPPARVVQNDAQKWVGPYLGQLAGRYRTASTLWEALEIRRDLTPELACEVIARDLVADADPARAAEYYGRIVAFLDSSRLEAARPVSAPALTSLGWRPPSVAWWSSRAEVVDAFGIATAWWRPGDFDPSALRRAAGYLGVREVRSASSGGLLSERWEVGDTEPIEIDVEGRWRLAVRTWPRVLRRDSDPAAWAALDQLARAVDGLEPIVASRFRIHFSFATDGEPVRASISPEAALRERDHTVLAVSPDHLFSSSAADAIATLLEANHRPAAGALALLLSQAAHDPDVLFRRAGELAVSAYQHREFTFEPAEFEELEVRIDVPGKLRRPRSSKPAGGDGTETVAPLADTERFGLVDVTAAGGSGPAPEALAGGRLKPPADEDGDSADDPGQGKRRPPAPSPRYSNLDIEGAARPFIEEYELSTRGCTIARQGSNVGADFLASDGRYIEVKAFGGAAPDSFDLESPEWRAAQHPDIADRFWVYVVEHLRDGQPPVIYAVFNPVLDDGTSKEPTGKLRVRGWRNARRQHLGQFAERQRGEPEPA